MNRLKDFFRFRAAQFGAAAVALLLILLVCLTLKSARTSGDHIDMPEYDMETGKVIWEDR